MKTLCKYLLIAVMFLTLADLAVAQGKKAAAAPASSAAQPATPTASSSAAIESQMLAFGGLDDIANAISVETCSRIFPNGSGDEQTLVIFDQASFANIQSYQGFIANAMVLKSLYYSLLQTDEYDKVEACRKSAIKKRSDLFPHSEEAQAVKQKNARAQAEADAKRKAACVAVEKAGQPCLEPRAIGLSSSIDPFSDATSLLSAIAVSSNSESPGSIVIPDSAMAVAFTNQMRQHCSSATGKLTIIYPPLFGRSSVSDISTSDMQSVLQELHDTRSCVIQRLDERNDEWVQKQQPSASKGATGAQAPAPGSGTPAVSSNPITTPALTDANGMYDSFMNSLLQVNSNTGAVGSGAIEQGYQLATVLAGAMDQDKTEATYSHPAYILLASILSAGGTIRDHKTLWTALSTGDKFTFSGGLVVNVALWQANSKMPLYTGILRYRVPFSDVADPTHPSAGDHKPYSDATKGDNLPNIAQ
ncbi:MAG: hypothetical protein WCC04_20745 [Terriglobales bacterium]